MTESETAVSRPESNETLTADTLVVGGGIAGMTVAIETSEVGKKAVLLEREPSIGGRVASMNMYFPKLCPPACGMEINLRRIRSNPNIEILTLSEVETISGSPGNFSVTVRVNPRYVNARCTACGDCEKVCEIERENVRNEGLDKTRAIYLPHLMAYPPIYVVDPEYAKDDRMKKCVEACQYNAIDLEMKPKTVTVNAKAIVWATGWKPYDATKIDNLGFGQYKNVITSLMMERMASVDGPTDGKITRPSDGKDITRIGFVQCAGSRDENHLPYCSAVCCLASMKHATYVRERYPEAEIHLFYIDVRSPGKLEDFYNRVQDDEKIFFHRGKVGRITENPENNNLILEAENTLTGNISKTEVDMAVLATGLVPNTLDNPPPIDTEFDEFGFMNANGTNGIIGCGTVIRPFDVAASVQDATGATLKALNVGTGR
ncbi:MAG: CoB--CoM heterodisulfide reductase iron-sulfur subunit A family protein [Candidatus Zixiibacteriota bacterium]|nr:MAG: CoB--CoM heterodisulfide reductase iron-sulfur subunit A family protein [candidate division Zixibacteria bacterium]